MMAWTYWKQDPKRLLDLTLTGFGVAHPEDWTERKNPSDVPQEIQEKSDLPEFPTAATRL